MASLDPPSIRDIKREISIEVDAFLKSMRDESIENGLTNYPNIQRVFLKYNCIRSSEAICERLFSYAGDFLLYLYKFSFQISQLK